MKFTKEQQKVIDTRNCNLLVSAAAGSGKTAVLVERIIQMVTCEDNPVDIDQLLVVTFTNAAATEMRERISEAIERKIEENPSQKRLHKQLILIPNANIMTIHSFCLKVIKNYFNTIHLDPGFQIGDENELLLLKNDVIKTLLEEQYEAGEEAFLNFVESYSGSKSDASIEALILDLYRFSMSNPWPKQWIEQCTQNLNISDINELMETGYYHYLVEQTKLALDNIMESLMEAKAIALMENGPEHYLESIQAYLEQILAIQAALTGDYEALKHRVDMFETIKLSSKRKGFDLELKERAKALIDYAKETMLDLKAHYFLYDLEDVLKDIEGTYKMVKVLGELTQAFSERYQMAKEEKNVIDFNDIEHYALEILVQMDETGVKPTEVAQIYQDLFAEILIDEYQDSNLVQETLLNAVSKTWKQQPNIFMVGDVKQSIYKFRLAKPELFMEKYEAYKEDGLYQRIDLHKNFRSREQVINFINYIFKQIMSKDMGDVTYDEKAALYTGADFEQAEGDAYAPEVIIVHQTEELSETENDYTQKQLEAIAVAERIYEMVNGSNALQVFDKKSGHYRKIRYSDIVILLRTTSGWTDVYLEALNQKNIPAYSSTTTGYFETLEIQTMMNLLKIIDNPRQDIPLVAVLRSPIVGLKGEDLVKIRKANQGEMYQALVDYMAGSFEESPLMTTLQRFMTDLKYFRKIAKYMPMDELLEQVFERTRYDYYTALMPNGVQRKANLELFVDKAVAYEKTSYRGVFDFIRYVENIHKYDIDTGEAQIYSEKDNLVSLMSIHKSKGLEFPVVFVAALGKSFNKQDLKQPIVYHQDLGIGADYVNLEERYRVMTLPKMIIREQMNKELLSEELRILYVALTRAKEKLILVGSVKNLESKLSKWQESLYHQDETMSLRYLNGCNSFLDWLMGAVIRHPEGKEVREQLNYDIGIPIALLQEASTMKITFISENQLLQPTTEADLSREEKLLLLLNQWKTEDMDTDAKITKNLDWDYRNKAIIHAKVQMSVTDIKKMHFALEEPTFEKKSYKPKFMGETTGLTAAEKGTAFHTVMCHLNLDLKPETTVIREFLTSLKDKNILTEAEVQSINIHAILQFLRSDLCARMIKAKMSLRRETPFVVGIPAYEMYQDLDEQSEDIIMIQGVIDAFFEEEDEIVLIDYKTDFLQVGDEALLIRRYEEQMYYYKRALEQILDKKVKEVILYALNISKEIIAYPKV